MKAVNSLAVLTLMIAVAAGCSKSSPDNASTPAPPPANNYSVNRGGPGIGPNGLIGACPLVRGFYHCSPTPQELEEGRTGFRMRLQQRITPDGIPLFAINRSRYIADGRDHQSLLEDGVLRYTVDCQQGGITLRTQLDGYDGSISHIRPVAPGEIIVESSGIFEGRRFTGGRRCFRRQEVGGEAPIVLPYPDSGPGPGPGEERDRDPRDERQRRIAPGS